MGVFLEMFNLRNAEIHSGLRGRLRRRVGSLSERNRSDRLWGLAAVDGYDEIVASMCLNENIRVQSVHR